MNKPRFLFVIFNMFFPENVSGSELESHHASKGNRCIYVLPLT